jgi:hypothetical protein
VIGFSPTAYFLLVQSFVLAASMPDLAPMLFKLQAFSFRSYYGCILLARATFIVIGNLLDIPMESSCLT